MDDLKFIMSPINNRHSWNGIPPSLYPPFRLSPILPTTKGKEKTHTDVSTLNKMEGTGLQMRLIKKEQCQGTTILVQNWTSYTKR